MHVDTKKDKGVIVEEKGRIEDKNTAFAPNFVRGLSNGK